MVPAAPSPAPTSSVTIRIVHPRIAIRSAERSRRGPAAPGTPRRPRPRSFFLGVAQEEALPALEDVEGVLHVVVIVPRHLLTGTDLELRDPEARALGVTRAPLDLVQMTRVLDRLHGHVLPLPG